MTLPRRTLLAAGLGLTAAGVAAPLATRAYAAGLTGSTWQSGIPDDRSLAALTIPGTHDSCALYGGSYVQCQTASIAQQLAMGVRFLDIRARNYRGDLPIHHEAFFQNIYLGQVLDQCRAFLRAHPSETILMSVRQEYSTTDDWAMSATWQKVTAPYADILSTGGTVPTLGQARGKVVTISRSGGIPGIPWTTARVSDVYDIKTADSWRQNKWPAVTSALAYAATTGSRSQLHVTFTSSWGPLLNPAAANGLMEPALQGWLDARPRVAGERLGVVVGDFAKDWKVQQVGARNFGRAYWA